MTAPAPVPVVVIVGMGGLGCPAARALASSGFPLRLRLVDEDRVEEANLHRQHLFTEGDIGATKVSAAARSLRARWPAVEVDAVAEHLAPDSAKRLLAGAALVIEGADNFPTKFLVSDVCQALRLPAVHGACVAWRGTVLPVMPGEGACYRCVFEAPPSDGDAACDCVTAGVFGPVTAVVGALLAADALRLLRGDTRTAGCLARYDGWRQDFRATRFRRRPDCPSCGPRAPE